MFSIKFNSFNGTAFYFISPKPVGWPLGHSEPFGETPYQAASPFEPKIRRPAVINVRIAPVLFRQVEIKPPIVGFISDWLHHIFIDLSLKNLNRQVKGA
jgi:hypothetical protein